MVRLSDLSRYDRDHVLMKQLPPLEPFSWVERPNPVSEMRFAVITTAGLHVRGEENFELSDASYRVIASDQDTVPTLTSYMGTGGNNVPPINVRRLTPRECERLQGFPDDYTLIPYKGKDASDAVRYHALGNSWAVSVVRWIGRRIVEVVP